MLYVYFIAPVPKLTRVYRDPKRQFVVTDPNFDLIRNSTGQLYNMHT